MILDDGICIRCECLCVRRALLRIYTRQACQSVTSLAVYKDTLLPVA